MTVLLVFAAYWLSTEFLKRSDSFLSLTDKWAFNAKEKGYERLAGFIQKAAGFKLFWCNPCQTFWLSFLLLNSIDSIIGAFINAIAIFAILKFKLNRDEL